MKKISNLLLIGLTCASLFPAGVSAKTVSAIPSVDEREFVDATTRCLTPEMKKLNDAARKQMEKDIKKAGPGYDEAAKLYQTKLEIIWDAMKEPYCGYGRGRLVTVRKSFQKSVTKTRTEFLTFVKKNKPNLVAVQE